MARSEIAGRDAGSSKVGATSIPVAVSAAMLPKLAYSIDEAVVVSGLSRSFIYVAIKDGRLTAIKAGSRTLVTTAGLQAFLASLPTMQSEKHKPRAT